MLGHDDSNMFTLMGLNQEVMETCSILIQLWCKDLHNFTSNIHEDTLYKKIHIGPKPRNKSKVYFEYLEKIEHVINFPLELRIYTSKYLWKNKNKQSKLHIYN